MLRGRLIGILLCPLLLAASCKSESGSPAPADLAPPAVDLADSPAADPCALPSPPALGPLVAGEYAVGGFRAMLGAGGAVSVAHSGDPTRALLAPPEDRAVLGLGLAGLGGASLALDGRCINSLDPCERLYTGRVAGTAELVTGGLLLGAGTGLIALGVTWRRKDQRQHGGQASVLDFVRPWLHPAQRSPLTMARLP